MCQFVDDRGEYRLQQLRLGRVEHGADVVVGGDPGQLEQCLAVGSSMTLLELALMRQERRALHKEDRECHHGDVRHRIGGVLPPTPVWEALEALAEAAEQGTQALHLDVESYFVAVSEFPAAPTRRIFSKCGNSDSLLAQSAMAFSLGALTSGSPGVDQLLQMRLVRIENRWAATSDLAASCRRMRLSGCPRLRDIRWRYLLLTRAGRAFADVPFSDSHSLVVEYRLEIQLFLVSHCVTGGSQC